MSEIPLALGLELRPTVVAPLPLESLAFSSRNRVALCIRAVATNLCRETVVVECNRLWGAGSPALVTVERPPLRPVVNTGCIDDKAALSAVSFVFGLIDVAATLRTRRGSRRFLSSDRL
jgi:hypothetical protein